MMMRCCISFDSYIKPQPCAPDVRGRKGCISFDSYIKPQQVMRFSCLAVSCISFDSYIKPQLVVLRDIISVCCISFDSYIKPQPVFNSWRLALVVYLLIPTSNHNLVRIISVLPFVVYLLIPTSNHNYEVTIIQSSLLYIFWFLHQTTTYRFESTDFQHITITFSNKKWWVGYNFLCKSTKKTPIE